MSALTIAETLAIEAAAKANGWSEEQLLNLAGERLGRAIGRYFPKPGTVVGYLGKGHNAGDTLVALRILRDEFGWKIAARLAFPIDECAPLTRMKWDELGIRLPLDRTPAWRDLEAPLLLLDGLLGSGTSGALAGAPRPTRPGNGHACGSRRAPASRRSISPRASIRIPAGFLPTPSSRTSHS